MDDRKPHGIETDAGSPSSESLRRAHVARYIEGRGLRDERVIQAMRSVPRELFMPGVALDAVYGDHPWPIPCEQTISQPYMVAWMTDLLRARGRILEIGTGSGYQTAVLSLLCEMVYTIERHAELLDTALERLRENGYDNVRGRVGDGTLGWPEEAPFDGILVTAGAPAVPESLKQQLAPHGRLVIPIGDRFFQEVVVVVRTAEGFRESRHGGCRFVPLIGAEGW